MSARRLVLALLGVAASLGCSAAARPLILDRVDAERSAPLVVQAQSESHAMYAKAESLRAQADAAVRAGDVASAELYGEHAIAAYEHAVAIARRIAAKTRKDREAERRARAEEHLTADAAARTEVERDADRLEGEIAVRREALLPATSGKTDGAREAARWVAVRANVTTADALCTGAGLLAPQAKGLADAKSLLADVSSKVESGKGDAPIDASMRARALCLSALTHARDVVVAGGGPSGDALLAELSGMGGLSPVRDERGVVATLPQLPPADATFDGGAKPTKKGKDALDALGRVAKTHPTFAVVVVVHSAGAAMTKRDQERGAAVKQALVAAGADGGKLAVQLAGAKLPAFDPTDGKLKAKNERVEVIFVGGGK